MTQKSITPSSSFRVLLLGLLLNLFAAPCAWTQTPFYEGKTITIISSSAAGGTADLRTKAFGTFLQKYIPGRPTVIMEYMPGGGGRNAANHMYSVARPDGLTIGRVSSSMVANAVLGEAGVRYDIDKFHYLGASESAVHYSFLTRKAANLNNLEKVRAATGLRLGSPPVGHTVYILTRVFAYLLALKDPKFIPGYEGPELDQVVISGEVDARVTVTSTMRPEWIKDRLVDFHLAFEVPKGHKVRDLANLPPVDDFAKSERDKKLLAVLRGFRVVGAPLILPPRTPKERVQILQEAMRKTLKDPEFLNQYKKNSGDDATPVMPEEQEEVIRDLPRDPEVIDLVKRFSGTDPIPSR